MGGELGEGGEIDVRTDKVQKSEQSSRSKAGRDEGRWHVWLCLCMISGDRVQNNRDGQTDQNCSCRGVLTLAILM